MKKVICLIIGLALGFLAGRIDEHHGVIGVRSFDCPDIVHACYYAAYEYKMEKP